MNSQEALKAGYDRYSLAECATDANAIRLAACIENEPFWHMPDLVKGIMRERVVDLYDRIPVTVMWVPEEPYFSCEDMQKDVHEKKQLRVKHRMQGHLGRDTEKWRAVHDFYGHFETLAPFNGSGELRAYARHAAQFHPICHPYIWNNVVLENFFRLNRGRFLCYPNTPACPSKIVFDIAQFGPEQDWMRAHTGG